MASNAPAPGGWQALTRVADDLWEVLPTQDEAWGAVDKAADKVTELTKEGTDVLAAYLSPLWEQVTGSRFGQETQDRMQRVQAEWRWGSYGASSRLHVPIPSEVDQRFLLAAASLAKVAADQIQEHGDAIVFRRPVTVVLVCAEAVAFFFPGGLPLRELCLSPFCVWEKGQWLRLLTPAIIHMDATHLMSNLATALPDCLELEASGGSVKFAAELFGLTGLSHAVYVAWAVGSKAALRNSVEYYSVGAVGLSSVAFALQVVTGQQRKGRAVILGIPVPSQFSWVFGVALAQLCSPSTSFPGHMSGVLAGVLYVHGILPVAQLVKQSILGRGSQPSISAPGPGLRGFHFWGAGTTGGNGSVPVSFSRAQSRSRWWRSWALSLGSQLGLVAITTGVYLVSTGRCSSRRPINSWQLR